MKNNEHPVWNILKKSDYVEEFYSEAEAMYDFINRLCSSTGTVTRFDGTIVPTMKHFFNLWNEHSCETFAILNTLVNGLHVDVLTTTNCDKSDSSTRVQPKSLTVDEIIDFINDAGTVQPEDVKDDWILLEIWRDSDFIQYNLYLTSYNQKRVVKLDLLRIGECS